MMHKDANWKEQFLRISTILIATVRTIIEMKEKPTIV